MKGKLVTTALVIIVALSVMSAAGVLTTTKAQAAAGPYAPSVSVTMTQYGATVDDTHPAVTGLPVTVTVTMTQAAGTWYTTVQGDSARLHDAEWRYQLGTGYIQPTFLEGTGSVTVCEFTSDPLTAAVPLYVDVYVSSYSAHIDAPGYPTEEDSFVYQSPSFPVVTPVTKALLQKVNDLATPLSDPATTTFTTPQSEDAFVNKLTALSELIVAGSYDDAQAKLTNDLVKYNAKWGTETIGDTLTDIAADLAILQQG